jgi:hypothetical protein
VRLDGEGRLTEAAREVEGQRVAGARGSAGGELTAVFQARGDERLGLGEQLAAVLFRAERDGAAAGVDREGGAAVREGRGEGRANFDSSTSV